MKWVKSRWWLVTNGILHGSGLEPVSLKRFYKWSGCRDWVHPHYVHRHYQGRWECWSAWGQKVFEKDLDSLDWWALPNCMTFNKVKHQDMVCNKPMQQYMLREDWKVAQQKRSWGYKSTASWTWARCVPKWPGIPMVPWLALEIGYSASVGKEFSPCIQHCWDHTSLYWVLEGYRVAWTCAENSNKVSEENKSYEQ